MYRWASERSIDQPASGWFCLPCSSIHHLCLMATRRRFGKRISKLLLPILLVLVAALVIALITIVYGITIPPRRSYLVTPETFSNISGTGRALKVTEETWKNRDGTSARGWLLRGAEGAPA